jgi:hypothetical protein
MQTLSRAALTGEPRQLKGPGPVARQGGALIEGKASSHFAADCNFLISPNMVVKQFHELVAPAALL